jgi:2-C-methyl-D-erythritol 4-phosphate cytidylyltransferase
MTASAVLVAAGRGERMGAETRKAFLELAGRPLFAHAVETFVRIPRVGEIVVVVHRDDLDAATEALATVDPKAIVIAGGATRRDSSLAGVRAATSDIVLIHDGCRPFADPALIDRVLDAVERYGAAVPVLPSVDTLYLLDRGGSAATVGEVLDRTTIARVQTPQGFRRGAILRALESADPSITDDGSAATAAGLPVVVVEGTAANLKVTVPEDLKWAEAFATQEG